MGRHLSAIGLDGVALTVLQNRADAKRFTFNTLGSGALAYLLLCGLTGVVDGRLMLVWCGDREQEGRIAADLIGKHFLRECK